ncbi:helix-turn-helix domain-containing protein [Microvirga splendida]
MSNSPWKKRSEAADYLRRSPKTLANWASEGRGPRFTRKEGRPLYHINDLDTWARSGSDSALLQQRGRPLAVGGQHG